MSTPSTLPGRHDIDGDFTPEQRAYRRARRAVRALRGWYIHLTVYLAVNALLWTKFLLVGGSEWSHGRFQGAGWPVGPTVFWGIGLLIHGLVVWLRASQRGRDWESRKIREFMDRDAG